VLSRTVNPTVSPVMTHSASGRSAPSHTPAAEEGNALLHPLLVLEGQDSQAAMGVPGSWRGPHHHTGSSPRTSSGRTSHPCGCASEDDAAD
jgi:hypothetical protein